MLPTYKIEKFSDEGLALENLTPGHFDIADPAALRETISGNPAPQKSEVRIMWDDNNIYAYFCFEDRDPRATYQNHDDPLYEENAAEIFLDPLGSGKAYFELEVNPLNAGFDSVVLNSSDQAGGRGNFFHGVTQWDPKTFKHRVVRSPEKWEVFISIGFKDLFLAPRIPPRAGDRWRGNFFRVDGLAEKTDLCAWSPTGVADFHRSEAFGILLFQ